MAVLNKRTLSHDYVPGFDDGKGVSNISQVSWNNPTTKAAFEQMFAIKPHEVLNGVELTPEGIIAYVGRKLP